jgi:hypothetical protein
MDVELAGEQLKGLAADVTSQADGPVASEDGNSAYDDLDDDMDSEELRQDLRAYGIQQLLPLDVRE